MSQNNDKKSHLIKVGLSIMSKKGAGSVGLNEVLQVAGIPKGSFYNYFASKEDFIVQLIEHETTLSNSISIGSSVDDIIDTLRGMISGFEGNKECWKTMFCNNAGPLSQSGEEVRAHLKNCIHVELESIKVILWEAQQNNKIRKDKDVSEIATFFWDSWQGALLRAQVLGSVEPLYQVVEFVLCDFIYSNSNSDNVM